MASEQHNIGLVGTAARELVRCLGSPKVVASIFLANTSASNRKITLRHVPADETPDDKFSLFNDVIVRANTTTTVEVPIFLRYGDVLDVSSDGAAAVAVTAYSIGFDDYLRLR
jgi:hypothetical protein